MAKDPIREPEGSEHGMGNDIYKLGRGQAVHHRPNQEPDGKRRGAAARSTRLAAVAAASLRSSHGFPEPHTVEFLTLGRFPQLPGSVAGARARGIAARR